jgi:hypothetical protein
MRRLALLLLALALAGCERRANVTFSSTSGAARLFGPGDPSGAEGAVAAVHDLEHVWERRDVNGYRLLLTGDFLFVPLSSDSSGNAFRGTQWTREDELAAAQHLFVGGGSLPAARTISVSLDPTLVSLPDPRPGKDPRWHRIVGTWAASSLRLKSPGAFAMLRAGGLERFSLVRGDSVAIPAEELQRGVRPDSMRWWIERWDEVGPLEPQLGVAAPELTWFGLKARYR